MKIRYTVLSLAVAFTLLSSPAVAQGWSQPLQTNTSRNINGLFSVSSTLTIAVGNLGTIIGTSDGGNTWSTGVSGTTNNLRKVFVSGLTIPVITAVGDNGTIIRSSNAGVTWTPWTSGVTLDLHDIFVHDPTNGTTMTVVGESGVILWTNNGGSNWMLRLSPTPGNLNGVFFKTLLEGFTVGDAGVILHTINNGNNWTPVVSNTTANLNHVFFPHADTGWIVGDGGTLLKSTDGGASWDPQTSLTAENLRRVMFTSTGTGTIVGDGGVIFRTTDGGGNWNQQTSGTGNDLTSVFFVDANYGMVSGESGLVIATVNGGVPVELSSFSATTMDDGSVRLGWETESETRNFGFEVQRDAGDGWVKIGFVEGNGDSRMARSYSFTDRSVPEARLLRYRLRQIDYDGSWENLPAVTVASGVSPASVELGAWPNPFSSSTNLQVTLPQSSFVRLHIHDITGRRLAVVHEGALNAGSHVLPWKTDGLPSGRYLAVLGTGDGGSDVQYRTFELILQR
jgi:photosystem II stability/assembly factor-like uncharacterized protein